MSATVVLRLLLVLGVLPLFAASQEFSPRPDLIDAKTEAAIQKGLAYLARTQNQDGSWSSGQSAQYPTVMTSLAGLALLSAGNTPSEGRYSRNVARAVDYLVRSGNQVGLISSMAEESRSMYGHGFAMLFLAEVHGMETNPVRQREIANVLSGAVKLTARSQSRDGGWLYTPDANADEGSVTVTQIQGLRACRNAGIEVPKSTIDRACAYIGKCANEDGGISYSLRSRGRSLPAITAAAVATMYNGGRYEHPVAKGALGFTWKLLQENKMDVFAAFRGHTYYSTLYASQAMWLASEEKWQAYFPPVRDRFVQTQAKDGSWDGDRLGGTFGTSVALLVLQLPYRHLPILQR